MMIATRRVSPFAKASRGGVAASFLARNHPETLAQVLALETDLEVAHHLPDVDLALPARVKHEPGLL
jgi:hypothetical protein